MLRPVCDHVGEATYNASVCLRNESYTGSKKTTTKVKYNFMYKISQINGFVSNDLFIN